MEIKISIIVPCFGVESFLDRCMESLLGQTLKEIEVILIDDGSPDKVPAMCDEYARRDPRIKVIHKQNEGLGYARNSGLDVAQGEFVAFVDSDDYVDLNMYETLYDEAVSSRADAVFCGFKIEQKSGGWLDRTEVSGRTEFCTKNQIDSFMLDMIASAPYVKEERKYWMSVWHAIYRRDVIEKDSIRFYSEREVVSEDIPFQCEFFQRSTRIVYIPRCYYYYCLNGTSLTKTFKFEKYNRFKELHQVLSSVTQNVPDSLFRIDRLFIGYVRSLLVQMYEMQIEKKDDYLNSILNDEIWNKLGVRYKVSFLPLYPRLVYTLILHKQKKLLSCIMGGVALIRK